jgi:hypothetical protein
MRKLVIAAGILSFVGLIALAIAATSYRGYLNYLDNLDRLGGCDSCPHVAEWQLRLATIYGIIAAIFLPVGGWLWLKVWKPALKAKSF